MKKMLVVLALAMVSFASAQKKGSFLVMGSIDYSSQKVSNSGYEGNNSDFTFSPKVGYQFHQSWTAGLELGVGSSKNELDYSGVYKENNFSFGGFVRYAKPLNQTFSAYADLGLGYQSVKETYTVGAASYIDEGDGYYIGVTPAILVNVGKGFGLNFNVGGLGYNTLNYDGNNGNGDDVKNFNISFGQQFSVGISKFF